MSDSLSDVMWWSKLWRLARRVFSSASRPRATCRSCGPKSSARPVLTAKSRKPRKHIYYLIYRLPNGQLPEPGFSVPVGGLVVPIGDLRHVKSVGEQRYHRAPYETLWFEDVSHLRDGRVQARELQWVWEIEMDAWLEMVSS